MPSKVAVAVAEVVLVRATPDHETSRVNYISTILNLTLYALQLRNANDPGLCMHTRIRTYIFEAPARALLAYILHAYTTACIYAYARLRRLSTCSSRGVLTSNKHPQLPQLPRYRHLSLTRVFHELSLSRSNVISKMTFGVAGSGRE